MSLNDQIIRQRDFTGGEINPDAIRRDDMELLKFAVRYARNMVSTNTGAITRRPGRRRLFEDRGVIEEFKPFDDVAYRVVFVAGRVKIRSEDGALVASLAAPWTESDLESLVVETMDNEIFIAWRGAPQVVTVQQGTLMWSIGAYAFSVGIDGARRTPFYRFKTTLGISMKPAARTGSNINVVFSAPVLVSAYVGVLFRYAGRQLRITNVLSATTARATIVEELPPTYDINVASASGFSIGQIVETDTTNMKGGIVKITGNQLQIVVFDKLTVPTNGETIVGPTASSTISSFAEASEPGATTQWDEQFISAYRGYPRSVSKDRQRLIFCNFPQFKSAVLWSATGDNRDFEVGADPDDAIFEYISAECQVFHVTGGYDEFVITDKGVYYVPVSVGTPLQPGSVEFRPIFSQELANVKPVEVTEGVIFIDKSGTGIFAISATGQTARPYIANEINPYSRHLFEGVKSIAVTSGTGNFPTRQIYAVNADGTVVVGQFNANRDNVGWLKWGNGIVRSVTGSYGSVLFMTDYDFGGDSVGVAEQADYDLLFDCATTFDTSDQTDFLSLANGSPLTLADGSKISLSGTVATFYAGREVDVHGGGFYLGKIAVPESGIITTFAGYDELTIGVSWDWEMTPLFPRFDDGQPVGQGEQRRKVEHMVATVRETQEFQIGNRVFGSHRGGEDMAEPVPTRDDTYKYREVGRSYDPVVPIKSTFPGNFKLIELATRITV